MTKTIIWLASYPKSGNTWFRVFMSNLIENKSEPVSINSLKFNLFGWDRDLLDDLAGIQSSDCYKEEIFSLRRKMYILYAKLHSETEFCKIHDAYIYTSDGYPLVPKEVTLGVIYLIRNPLDVAVSYAYHNSCDIDRSIKLMADNDHCLAISQHKLCRPLPQRLLSWSNHVMSWVSSGLKIYVIRYEDMIQNPFKTFCDAVIFAGFSDFSKDRILKAIEFSNFSELKKQEEKSGFLESPPNNASFFRKGRVGGWREIMTEVQVEKIVQNHNEVMRRFGYLTEEGQIVF
jgi:aryl sulfotransferase